MKSDNKSHPTYPPNRQPNDPYRDRNPDYRNDLSQVDPNYRDAYTRESLRNQHLARENDSLRYGRAVERDRLASRYQADTGRNFLLGILIIGLAALGFGIFYYAGRSETVEQPTLPNPVEVPVPEQPEAETPDINIQVPSNPPDVQLPEINVPDVDVQVPDATGGAESTAPAPAPAPAEGTGTTSNTAPAGTAPAGTEAPATTSGDAGSETPQ